MKHMRPQVAVTPFAALALLITGYEAPWVPASVCDAVLNRRAQDTRLHGFLSRSVTRYWAGKFLSSWDSKPNSPVAPSLYRRRQGVFKPLQQQQPYWPQRRAPQNNRTRATLRNFTRPSANGSVSEIMLTAYKRTAQTSPLCPQFTTFPTILLRGTLAAKTTWELVQRQMVWAAWCPTAGSSTVVPAGQQGGLFSYPHHT